MSNLQKIQTYRYDDIYDHFYKKLMKRTIKQNKNIRNKKHNKIRKTQDELP